jgi:hypothetical protein
MSLPSPARAARDHGGARAWKGGRWSLGNSPTESIHLIHIPILELFQLLLMAPRLDVSSTL